MTMAKGKIDSKDEFLKVFEKALGNIFVACSNFGIDRKTFYNWYNEDENFKQKADAVKELRKDFLESAFDKRVKAGDTTAIIFGLKTQCKDRGYVEKSEHEVEIKGERPIFNIAPNK
jgi:hypothetical protein